jgi:hypothetical protein
MTWQLHVAPWVGAQRLSSAHACWVSIPTPHHAGRVYLQRLHAGCAYLHPKVLDSCSTPPTSKALSAAALSALSLHCLHSHCTVCCCTVCTLTALSLHSLSLHCLLLQVRDLLVPLVQPWVPLICGVLATDPAARAAWPIKLGALRLGLSITSYFSKPLSAAMPHLMSATWQLLLALQVGGAKRYIWHVLCSPALFAQHPALQVETGGPCML